jgi:nicotinate-nucleotide adenylyltransferase
MNPGILGGAFDPPHNAHLLIAGAARDQLGLDTVLFIPYATGPHRPEGPVAGDDHRLQMVRLCVAGHDGLQVDDRELGRGGVSYTVDTLEELAEERPGERPTLILGADQLAEFTGWRSWERILELADLAGLRRTGHPVTDVDPAAARRLRWIDLPLLEISSTLVRERIAAGSDISHLVPPAVARYIEEHRLYT